jgi:capsular polysaccharide transport system permease protein
LAAKGLIEEALRHAGALLAMAPDEPEYLSCMAYLLEAATIRRTACDFEDIAALKRRAPPRQLRPPVGFADKLRLQGRSISALVLRDVRSRYADSRLGFFWTLMEPFIHVGFLALVFEFTMHGRPPLGANFFFFYFTGVMPYLLMSHLTTGVGHVVRGNKNLLQIAQVTPFDLMLAKAIVEVFTSSLVYLLFSALFALAGLDPTPLYASSVAEAFGLTVTLGLGAGMICATLFEFGPAGESVVNILLRALYFASGIFYVPANMPMLTRGLLAYNPFLHIVDTLRMGYFANYEPSWNDPGYAAVFALLTLAAGMTAVKTMSPRMRSIP